MLTLEHSGTWELVPLLLGNQLLIVIGCMPLKSILMDSLIVSKYTSLLKGILKFRDLTIEIPFLPSVRLLLTMVAIGHWMLYQLDIKSAFLHSKPDKEIYMKQPPSFVAQGESRLVCKLQRSLYGLKQSPQAW